MDTLVVFVSFKSVMIFLELGKDLAPNFSFLDFLWSWWCVDPTMGFGVICFEVVANHPISISNLLEHQQENLRCLELIIHLKRPLKIGCLGYEPQKMKFCRFILQVVKKQRKTWIKREDFTTTFRHQDCGPALEMEDPVLKATKSWLHAE